MHLSAAELRGRQGDGSIQPSPTSSLSLSLSLSPTATSTTSSISPTATLPSTSTTSNAPPKFMPIVIGIIAAVLALMLLFFVLRHTRTKHKNPKYIPTPFLKRLWKNWEPNAGSRSHSRLPDASDRLEPVSTRSNGSSQLPISGGNAATRGNDGTNTGPETTTASGVGRNTSVRSVMTLPAYNPDPHQSEQVLGREGERGGIDVVVEFPEMEADEERLREEEMEALYQVRLARRRENEEREERRRLRREARERGDWVALRELNNRARASSTASNGRSVEELRAEHERIKKERQRAVSSVSYGDLGVARHDGTRLRANSMESEREGLLGDAASIAASSHYHRRDRSASSVISIDTINTDFPSPGLTRSRGNSRAESPFRQIGRPSQDGSITNEGRAGSSPEMVEHEDFPPNSPPGYENIPLDTQTDHHHEPPPNYSSPVVGRGEWRPTFESSESSGNGQGTRTSRVGEIISEHRGAPPVAADERDLGSSSSWTAGGIPQLPSLQLDSLPSIQVDPGSPIIEPRDRH
ncbi:hypothetical protein GLAREA_06950 [Glarea lozoyensis ATCC 20868]|uniref:Uncharacterized protein n=1 Tax=Glarea lozoyensis (strain ATCC 20868 / MF5171) TaxID=1116229 RepID=S3D645_GLAL2|nr:uncharacterized protein GLAREA_06950 [Glarea lozoyensis ATCC 20868]EPE33937.1 hypothetical protein GLAREA_06950 [Glarea lozoyensis ATCC 20868]